MKTRFHLFAPVCLSLFLPAALCWAKPNVEIQELRSGWYLDEPYQIKTGPAEAGKISGIDIQISRELFKQAGYQVTFTPKSWAESLEGLRTGEIDFLMGAYYEESRKEFAYYSTSYRTEKNDLYHHKGIERFAGVKTVQDVINRLRNEKLTLAVIKGHAYGSEQFAHLVHHPPPNLTLIPTQSYRENLSLMLEGIVDVFVANPIIMDRLIAETDSASNVQKLGIPSRDIPVHILFSKKNISSEQVKEFNAIIKEMQKQGRINDLFREFVLPAYLFITTAKTWFTVLNLLGIVAFCVSALFLARKERYNLFGALVLATLPAIGGGVLRDLFLGVDQVFVLKTPAYFLVAVSVVLIGFVCFKCYDFIHDRSAKLGRRIDRFIEKKLGRIVGQLFKFFDAWAVASFTVIGVGVALERRVEPLWLWAPAMAVLTASGGVILRDIVRADFNIEMLKQDTYAETSLLGGIIYTSILMYSSYELSLAFIFYLTMIIVFGLFTLRFFVLWKGYMNPLQFGDMYTHPDTHLQQFVNKEPELFNIICGYYTDDEQGQTIPVSLSELEGARNQFMYRVGELKDSLDQVAAQPLSERNINSYRQCNTRLDIVMSLENRLFTFLKQSPAPQQDVSRDGLKLQQLMHESLRTLIDTVAMAVESRDHMDFSMLERLTSEYRQRFDNLRNKYHIQLRECGDVFLEMVLQSTHKVERIIFLITSIP